MLENLIRALSQTPLGGAIRSVVSDAAHQPELSAALQAVTTARAMARTAWSYPSRLAIYDGDAGQIAELRTRPGELAPIT